MSSAEWDGLVDASVVDALKSGHWSSAAKMLFTTSKSVRDPQESAERLRRPVPSCRRVLVTSARGGAGRTATSALLSSVLALRRRDATAVVDADLVTGSLTARFNIVPRQSLVDLAGTIQTSDLTPATLGEILPQASPGLLVVPGGAGGDVRTVGGVTLRLSRPEPGLAAVVVDCGPELTMGNAVDLALSAHAIVLVTPWTPDGVRSTIRELSRIGQTERGRMLLSRTVVALNPVIPFPEALNQRRAAELLEEFGTPVVAMKYDDHLADGAPIQLERVSEEAVSATTNLAETVLDVAVRV